MVVKEPGVYKVEYSPPVGEGYKIKGFGDGEENQKLAKRKKEIFLRCNTFSSTKR